MRFMRSRLARLLATATIATVALVGATATAAHADALNITMYGTSGSNLGYGRWEGRPAGNNGQGYIYVYDNYCDGNNGIIAELLKWTGSTWSRIHLASVRGCGSSNTTHVKPSSQGGPVPGQELLLRVCKLLPDGTWKDCLTNYNGGYVIIH